MCKWVFRLKVAMSSSVQDNDFLVLDDSCCLLMSIKMLVLEKVTDRRHRD